MLTLITICMYLRINKWPTVLSSSPFRLLFDSTTWQSWSLFSILPLRHVIAQKEMTKTRRGFSTLFLNPHSPNTDISDILLTKSRFQKMKKMQPLLQVRAMLFNYFKPWPCLINKQTKPKTKKQTFLQRSWEISFVSISLSAIYS